MKKLMKSAICLSVTAMMGAALLTGCANSAPAPAEPAPAAPAAEPGVQPADTPQSGAEPVTISFWDGNWQEAIWPAVEQRWKEEYPHITVNAEFQADLANDKYMLALTNGTAPDVLSCALDWTTTFGSAGLLEPLDGYIASSGVDTNSFVRGAINASTIDGNLYALPFRSETYVMFYNKDILAAAGYDTLPGTWDEIKEVAAAATNGDVYGYGLTGANYSNVSFQYLTMLRSSGGDVTNADYTESALGSDAAVHAAQIYKDLLQFAPASAIENDNIANRTLFANGKIAMYMSGIYDAEEIVKIDPNLNFGCAMVPTSNNATRGSILGGWSVAVAKTSANKEAAWTFVNFLTRPDIAALYTNTFTGTATMADRYKDYPQDIVQPNADALQFASALPPVKNIVSIRQAIFDNIQLMLMDDLSAAETAKALYDATDALLE